MGKEKPPKFIAGIIVARRASTFLRLLYESYRDNYRPWDWDFNCARVAYQIYVQRPDLLHVEPYRFTTPDWQDRRLLWNEIIDWRQLYVLHVMGHFNWVEYDPELIRTINSTFGEAMRYIYYGSPKLIGDRVEPPATGGEDVAAVAAVAGGDGGDGASRTADSSR